MDLMVLMSCMHQNDTSIVQRSNIQTDAVVINQCNRDCVEKFIIFNKKGRKCNIIFVNTTERGLSKSRNMAIQYAEKADICLICDDDEWLDDNYEDKILKAYQENLNVDLIAFSLIRNDLANGKYYPLKNKTLGFIQIFKTSSLQITFKRNAQKKHNLYFDEKMGSGTGNGGGEENKFMFDFRRKGLKLYYVASVIATVNPGESQWFEGYNKKWFVDIGWARKKILGYPLAIVYCFYAVKHHRKYFKDKYTTIQILTYMMKGVFEQR